MITKKTAQLFQWLAISIFVLYLITIVLLVLNNAEPGDNKLVAYIIVVLPIMVGVCLTQIAIRKTIISGIILFIVLCLTGVFIYMLIKVGMPSWIVKLIALIILACFLNYKARAKNRSLE